MSYTIEEIEAMLASLTKGEWEHGPSSSEYLDGRACNDYEVFTEPEIDFVAEAISSQADAKFIAAAPAIIRQLLARVKEAEAECARLAHERRELNSLRRKNPSCE